jgi:hypothetical protein
MRTPRSTATVSGLLIVLLGVWGAIIAFIGPYFDYAFGVDEAWHFTTDRLWLNILPGAAAVLGGMLLAFSARRAVLAAGALLSLVAGAWFVVGPAVSVTWESAGGPIGRPLFGSTRQMLELVGYFYGLGALIVAFAAFSLGRIASVSRIGEQRTAVTAPDSGSAAQAEPSAGAESAGFTGGQPAAQEPLAAEPAIPPRPRRRIGLLRRRRGQTQREERGTPAGRQR